MIEHVDYHITDHCNLNCAGCDQFATLAKEWYVPLEQVKEEWENVAKSGLVLKKVHLLGGEPLLHPNFDDIIRIIHDICSNIQIVVYTNGILLPKWRERLIPLFNEYDIELLVSKYPHIKLDFEALTRGFSKVTINTVTSFFNTGLHLTPRFAPEASFQECNMAQIWKCRLLKENRIYACSMLPNLIHLIKHFPELKDTELGKLNIEDGGIDIRYHTPEEIEAFINKCVAACAFCNVNYAKQWHAWRPSEYKLEEWLENGSISNNTMS